MNISRINSQLNTRNAYSIPVRRTNENFDTGSISGSPSQETPKQQPEKVQPRKADRQEESFGAYDYAKLYNPDEKFSLKGRDSDPAQLDAVGTLGKMQRDELMGQYRTFANEAGLNNTAASTTPTIRGAENFSL